MCYWRVADQSFRICTSRQSVFANQILKYEVLPACHSAQWSSKAFMSRLEMQMHSKAAYRFAAASWFLSKIVTPNHSKISRVEEAMSTQYKFQRRWIMTFKLQRRQLRLEALRLQYVSIRLTYAFLPQARSDPVLTYIFFINSMIWNEKLYLPMPMLLFLLCLELFRLMSL